MENFDYNAKMLSKFFKEKGLSNGKVEYILNRNPFNEEFIIWEKQVINNNRKIAYIIKRNNLISEDKAITEFATHPDDSAAKYISNRNKVVLSSEASKIHLNYNSVILIKDLIYGEKDIIRNLDLRRTSVVMGVCTKNPHYYERCRKFYEEVTKDINVEKIEDTTTPQKLYIVKTK